MLGLKLYTRACCVQIQVDISTPSALTATLRRNLMEFFDENSKEFVPGGGTVIYLDSQDPLKMTLGVVFTFAHNGQNMVQSSAR